MSLRTSRYVTSSLTTFLALITFFLFPSFALHPYTVTFMPPCYAFHACLLASLHLPLICVHKLEEDRNCLYSLDLQHLKECRSLLMNQWEFR